jgi:hypothetical protein
MVAEFHDGGVCFRYPENWKLERQDTEDGWTVSVQSPDTAFMMICLREDMPSTNQVADAALDALREEYKDLEADDCIDSLAGQPAIGHDIRFFSLDLPNTCWTRSFYSAQGTVLVLCQVNDLELPTNEPVLRAMCASLKVDEE